MNQKLKILKISLTILGAIFFLQPNQASANCHQSDWEALKAIYDSMDGDNWTNRSGWDTYIDDKSTPPPNCNLKSLFGVTVQNGRVTKIQLWERHRHGVTLNRTLPSGADFRKLSHLKVLSFKGFSLSGQLPFFQYMPNLEELYLHENDLSGPAPDWKLRALVNVKKMRLDYNSFTGYLPDIGNYLTNIEYLYLAHNKFTGTIPSSYGNLSNLKWLTLQSNNLLGSFAPSLTNLCGINGGDPWDYYINRWNDFDQLWSSFCSGNRKASPNSLNESDLLGQNSPNPSIGSTAIKYFVPEQSETAELVLRDITGKTIEKIAIEQSGEGNIQFSTKELPNGIYSYTLYANGKMLASKKMIVAQQ